MSKPKVIAVLGPTASGKTALAAELCRRIGGEVVSCDSMQIYRRMDIGTAKPTPDEMLGVPHHMIDVCDPTEDYSVARYVTEASAAIGDVLARGKVPVIAGGTGLYADSLLSGCDFSAREEDLSLRRALTERYEKEGGEALLRELAAADPETAVRLHANDARRIIRALEVIALTGQTLSAHDAATRARPAPYDALRLVLCPEDRELLYRRIETRVDAMLRAGLAEEVRSLLDSGVSPRCTAMQAIAYKELTAALRGEQTVDEAREAIVRGTRHYAKRQLTWFRREDAVWLSYARAEDLPACIDRAVCLAQEHLQG